MPRDAARVRFGQTITDVLDVLALMLMAGGVGAAVAPWIGWAALIPAGFVVYGGSQLVARAARGGERG